MISNWTIALAFLIASHSIAAFADQAGDRSLSDWSRGLLLSAAFIEEYQAYCEANPCDGQQVKEELLPVWARANVAFQLRRFLDLPVPLPGDFERNLLARGVLLKKKDKSSRKLVQLMDRQKTAVRLSSEALSAIEETWTDPKDRQIWRELSSAWNRASLGPLACKIPATSVDKFVQHQESLLKSGSTVNPVTLLRPIQSWRPYDLACLSQNMLKNGRSDSDDPLFIFLALEQTSAPAFKLEPMKAILSARFIARQSYPEALRALIDLQEMHPVYRLPYNSVQRIYSIRQVGKGDVALQHP